MESNKINSLYSNRVEVSSNIIDFKLKFTLADASKGKSDSINIEDLVIIRMSPIIAKSLAQILKEQVKKYEDIHGEIFSGK